MKYTHRYIARIELEAETALFTGSGETSLTKDALVQKDHHGFPMIQGTSLTGVLRHALEENGDKEEWKSFFGFQDGKDGSGSKVKVSSAYLILNDGKIAEGIEIDDVEKSLLKHFENLPSRQHVRINDKGVAEAKGLFDNEVVYKGCRFVFEMEVRGDGSEQEKGQWEMLLRQMSNPLFRLGQGTRNGYGKMKVNSIREKTFDLTNKNVFDSYLNFDPSFNECNNCLGEDKKQQFNSDQKPIHYQLQLKADDFFIFNAGFGDDEVDNKPNEEIVVFYDKNEKVKFDKKQTLIPASSIKGAISHRTAFHHNRIMKAYADKEKAETEYKIGTDNDAVYELFGAEAGAKEKLAQRGKTIFNDSYLKEADNTKIFNHVAIDRFTGGAMDGHLFSEKVTSYDKGFTIDIYTEKIDDENVKNAFKDALIDICKGLLPLGGMTTKGHGMFTGKLLIDNEEKYCYA